MTDTPFHAPTAAEIHAIQLEAERMRSQAFGQAVRKLFSFVTSVAKTRVTLAPRCARPLH